MKFKKFMRELKEMILYSVDIDTKTILKVVDIFNACLNTIEKDKYSADLLLLHEKTSQQICLNAVVQDYKSKKLEQELYKLKGSEFNE